MIRLSSLPGNGDLYCMYSMAQTYIENVIIKHNWLIMMHTFTVVFVCDVLFINCNAKKINFFSVSRAVCYSGDSWHEIATKADTRNNLLYNWLYLISYHSTSVFYLPIICTFATCKALNYCSALNYRMKKIDQI